MKQIVTAFALIALQSGLFAADAPRFTVLTTKSVVLVSEDDTIEIHAPSRVLKIEAPAAGATAYKIDIITRDAAGQRRTWPFVVARHEQRYGVFEANKSATFFTIPVDLDIVIVDIFVGTLTLAAETSIPATNPAIQ